MLKRLSDIVSDIQKEDDRLVLDTRVPPVVRIINGALDEDENSPGKIILNGRIDPQTLRFLKVDQTYQRPLAERAEIFEALKTGIIVPNIDIGVRGQDFISEGDDYLIRSPAYIIDGWQRVGNALRLLELIPDHPLRIFATVHFGTDDVWERHRFTELNKNVKKVSPNLHLRNMRDGNEAVLTLYGLSNNTKEFPLYHKVSWGQYMRRGELISAYLFVRTVSRLHEHIGGSAGASAADKVAARLLKNVQKVSLSQFRKNVTTFFEVVEECWGVRTIEMRGSAPQIKAGFLQQLATMFSVHLDFWDATGRSFFVAADHRRKLAKFPMNDPHVKHLAGTGGGAASKLLYDILITHMNSGKRIGRLRSRYSR